MADNIEHSQYLVKCSSCGGTGHEFRGYEPTNSTCEHCGGSGEVDPHKYCDTNGQEVDRLRTENAAFRKVLEEYGNGEQWGVRESNSEITFFKAKDGKLGWKLASEVLAAHPQKG